MSAIVLPQEYMDAFFVEIDLATRITGLLELRMEREMVCWKWFLYVGSAMIDSTLVIH